MPTWALKIRCWQAAGRRGVTLIELLIVMVIMSIITAATIQLLNTGVGTRRVREAARLVSSYIGAAKSRAIETGRPAGVMFQRYNQQNNVLTLVSVEVPPPYAGDSTSSTATINTAGQLIGFPNDTAWMTLVHVGDIIRLGYQGRSYMLLGPTPPPSTVGLTPTLGSGIQLLSAAGFPGTACYLWATDGSLSLPAASTTGVPYQISRQPIKSAVQPLQLPEGTIIDLAQSGVGILGQFSPSGLAPYPNPIITFGSTGAVSFVYYDSHPPQHLQSALYLLVTRLEAPTANDVADQRNMWVAVGPQSGLVVTAEDMGGASLATARVFAQQASSMGGR